MAKPPNIQIPGLRRGAGIPPGHIVGRLPSAGKGPAQLLTQSALGRFGLATKAVVQGMIAAALANPSVGMGRPGMDGQDGEDGPMGPPGLKGDTGSTGATGAPAISPRTVVQQQCSSYNAGQTTSGFTTCILPSPPTKGNLLVAIMQWNSANGTPAAGTGWTLADYDHTTTHPFGVMSSLFYKYAGASESTSQTPGNAGLTYGSTNIWEISGVSGVWATDFVAFSYSDEPAGQPVTAFTDGGYATANANSLVLAFLGANNSIGYATPAAMTQIGGGTLVADTHIGATGGLSGVSAVAGHYTLVATAGTSLSGHSSVSNTSSWFSAYVEMTSQSAIGPTGATGATGAAGAAGAIGPQGMMGLDGADGEDGQTIPGAAGATGSTGSTGATGAAGAIGPQGRPGSDGDDGDEGQRGQPGAAGPMGPAGMMGMPGADGEDSDPFSAGWAPGLTAMVGATDSETPGNPSQPTSNTVFTMAGLAGSFTPKKSGNVLVVVKGTATLSSTSVAGDGYAMQTMYGTGTAPTNGATATGTSVGSAAQRQLGAALTAADRSDLTCLGIAQLVVGTTYWIDVQQQQKSVNNRASLLFPTIVVIEL